MTNARKVALDLLIRVQKSDSYINLLMPRVLGDLSLSDADRGLIQELSYGSLRWKYQYDSFIDQFTQGKTLSDELRFCLQLGLHQLFRMRVPSHAAIHESVELVKEIEKRAAGLANAVLRNADRKGFDALLADSLTDKPELEALAIEYSHPIWVIRALKQALELDGKESDLKALLESNNETPVVNLAALNPKAKNYLEELELEKGGASPIGYLLHGNPEPHLGQQGVRVQDQGSQLVALALLEVGDRSGRWLDMCSGPGGKSAILQSGISASGGVLDCMEPVPQRAQMVERALTDESETNVIVDLGQNSKPNSYDAVLLDAPCSGLGSVRRKPESRWRKEPSQLPQLTNLQQELLQAGIDSLKSGGYLLYSTCSPLIPETNTQIRIALDANPGMELVDAKEVIRRLAPGLEVNPDRKTVQLWTHLHSTDAMFMAILRKP